MAAVLRQQYAPAAVFAEQEISGTPQTITAPLVTSGPVVYIPSVSGGAVVVATGNPVPPLRRRRR